MRKRAVEGKWTYVASSAVRAIRYDAARAELDVRFEAGRRYRYSDVPRSKFRGLLKAESIGVFINHEIKPHHPCREIALFPRRQSKNLRRYIKHELT